MYFLELLMNVFSINPVLEKKYLKKDSKKLILIYLGISNFLFILKLAASINKFLYSESGKTLNSSIALFVNSTILS